jgi:hypothetical protein
MKLLHQLWSSADSPLSRSGFFVEQAEHVHVTMAIQVFPYQAKAQSLLRIVGSHLKLDALL